MLLLDPPCLSVCPHVVDSNSRTAERIFMKFDSWSFTKICRHIPILVKKNCAAITVISRENLQASLCAEELGGDSPGYRIIPVLMSFHFFLLAVCFEFSSASLALIDLYFPYRTVTGACAGITARAVHQLYCEPLCYRCISFITGAVTNQLQWLTSTCRYFMVAVDGQSECLCSWYFSIPVLRNLSTLAAH
jgi:hypothetical protein